MKDKLTITQNEAPANEAQTSSAERRPSAISLGHLNPSQDDGVVRKWHQIAISLIANAGMMAYGANWSLSSVATNQLRTGKHSLSEEQAAWFRE